MNKGGVIEGEFPHACQDKTFGAPSCCRLRRSNSPLAKRMCEIADRHGFTPYAVQAWKKRGVDIWDDEACAAHAAKCKSRLLSDDEKRAVVDLYEQGYGSQAIGKKLGREKTSIRAYLREVGLWTSERTKQSPAQRRKLVFGETDPRKFRRGAKKRMTRVGSLPLFKATASEKWMRRYKSDRAFWCMQNCRKRIRKFVSGVNKSASTQSLVGCTQDELRAWIERQFQPGMTWDNRGEVWHIDHVIPCSLFNLKQPEDQAQCFHFTNLRPMFARENIARSNAVTLNDVGLWAAAQILRFFPEHKAAGLGSAQ